MTQSTWDYDRLAASSAPRSQAARIIGKFGGPYRLARALQHLPNPAHHRHPSVIYRWLWPKGKGRGGRIPLSAWDGIQAAARLHGIYLTPEDMAP